MVRSIDAPVRKAVCSGVSRSVHRGYVSQPRVVDERNRFLGDLLVCGVDDCRADRSPAAERQRLSVSRLEEINSPMDSEITIVSGLPRSGTSLMMQMLDFGGMEVLTDNIRTADTDNP